MDTCKNCDKIMLSDYKFCPRCGLAVDGQTPQAMAPPPAEPGASEITSSVSVGEDYKETFFRIAQNLSKAIDTDSLLKKIGVAVEEILGAERSSIMLLDETGKNLYFKTASGEDILKKLTVPVGEGIAGWIAMNKKSDIVNDPYNDERFSPETDKKTGFTTKSIVGTPMIHGDDLIGIIEAINKKEGEFTEEDLQTLTGFSGLAAVSIANSKMKTDQKNFFSNMLDFLVMGSEAMGKPEPSKEGHTWEMARFAPQIAKELDMPPEKLQLINNAALIHDIGFLGLNNLDLIGINIGTELTDELRFKLHTAIGGEMLKGIRLMQDLIPFVQLHHLYRDGSGFPENLSPELISPEVEVISILEAYYINGEDPLKIDPQKFSKEVFDAFNKVVVQ